MVCTSLGNEQDMLFADDLGGCCPAANLKVGGAQMGPAAIMGRLGDQRMSRADEKSSIACPRWLSETKRCGDGFQYEKTNRKGKSFQKMR